MNLKSCSYDRSSTGCYRYNLFQMPDCVDKTYGAVDSGGDSCDWYINYQSYCGSYDTETFHASSMCCTCGGGETFTPEWRIDLDYEQGDTYAEDLDSAYRRYIDEINTITSRWKRDRDAVD